jgi:hypothetical protein
MDAGQRPWWDGHLQQRLTACWIVKIGNEYVNDQALQLVGTRAQASRWSDHHLAWQVAQDWGKGARVVRVVVKPHRKAA